MTSAALVQAPDAPMMRLSVPRRGHVLSSIAETYGGPIRAAVDIVATELERNDASLPQALSRVPTVCAQTFLVQRSAAEMTAWHLCTQWIVGVALGTLRSKATLVDAAQWFGMESSQSLTVTARRLSAPRHRKALEYLRSIADPAALADLLPYLLDPHGPGSRLSVMRDPSTREARDRRRVQGVFYTPADVAEHMAALALKNLGRARHPIRVFDPACGTGVFLRAALSVLRARGPAVDAFTLAQQCLYGVDIDPWAVDASAYVLLHDVLVSVLGKPRTPNLAWQVLRRNLSVIDALSLDPATRLGSISAKTQGGISITELFPAMQEGPHVVLGNPPYAALADRTDLVALATRFKTLQPVSPTSDIYPLFVEQMVRLAAPVSAGALVLPLSIAFRSGPQYVATRRLVERTIGTWRFSFFDREPHALFGEDVKTRNAIVTWKREGGESGTRIMTGPLLKWRGDSRAHMLRSIRYTEIQSSIATGIPKLSGSIQAQTLDILTKRRTHLAGYVSSFCSADLERTFIAPDTTLFVGGTAYNFLNVFFRPPAELRPRAVLSTNTVHGINCAQTRDALIVYAILSSRISFWLWHVLGDGFHVSRGFLEDLPLGFSLFTDEQLERLAGFGCELWREAKTYPVASSNRGRASLAFPASRIPSRQRGIDQVIVTAAGLPDAFLGAIDNFIDSVVFAEPSRSFNVVIPEDMIDEHS